VSDVLRREYWDVFQELEHPWETLEQWVQCEELAFDAKVRLHGPTVLDARFSYCIYKGPDVTTPYIVHNLYELIAFLAHPRHGLRRINVMYRLHPLPLGFKMLPLPWAEVYLATLYTWRGPRTPLVICVNGARWHTGAEGRSWWPA
jgi:hypothetical protein